MRVAAEFSFDFMLSQTLERTVLSRSSSSSGACLVYTRAREYGGPYYYSSPVVVIF